MDGGYMEGGARCERGDRDLALGCRQRLEEVERTIDRLDRSPGTFRGRANVFRFAQCSLRRESLEAQVASFPDAPGVYLFKDSRGRVLYVGKADVLRDRVRAYFGPTLD